VVYRNCPSKNIRHGHAKGFDNIGNTLVMASFRTLLEFGIWFLTFSTLREYHHGYAMAGDFSMGTGFGA